MEDEDWYSTYSSGEATDYDNDDDDDDDGSSSDHQDHDSLLDDYGNEALIAYMKPSSFKVITKESLLAAQQEDLQRVMDLISVKEHSARALLIHYRWNIEQLISVYIDRGEDHVFAAAGVTVSKYVDLDRPESSSTCDICMDEVSAKDSTKMDCSHCFCNNCWTEHFIVKIKDGESKRIRCMAYKCNAICDEAIIRRLVSLRQPDLADKFDRFLLESYIEDNKMVRWCPSIPHCGNAIRIDADKLLEVECSCGFQFCFNCASEAHSPCSCLIWKLWAKKCQDESETVNWITAHTKTCPKCYKAVEKNGGCNLVRCMCGQPFCWLCGAATGLDHTWESIANHTCGSYKEIEEKAAEVAKRELDRYIHYHNRYKAHTDSFEEEIKLQKASKEKINRLEAKNSGVVDFSWITNGLYRLSRARRAILYSYPFAYYMFGEEIFKGEMTKKERKRKQILFEDQQQQLESNMEKLSKFLEMPFDEYDDEKKINDTRMQIIALSGITDNLCKQMYNCIENDLLGSLQFSTHTIAPYQSKGIDKAEEFTF